MNKLIFGYAALLAGAAACGGSVVTGGSGGSGAASSTSTGAGASSSGSPCPSSATATTSCAGVPAGFRCTYGDETRPDCREATQCMNGQWTPTTSVCAMSTACGASQPAGGSVCSTDGSLNATCSFGDSICICGACAAGPCMAPPIEWECAGPPTTSGCPPVVPNDGTPCTAEGVTCDYGFTCTSAGAEVSCTNGLWLWNQMVACAG